MLLNSARCSLHFGEYSNWDSTAQHCRNRERCYRTREAICLVRALLFKYTLNWSIQQRQSNSSRSRRIIIASGMIPILSSLRVGTRCEQVPLEFPGVLYISQCRRGLFSEDSSRWINSWICANCVRGRRECVTTLMFNVWQIVSIKDYIESKNGIR